LSLSFRRPELWKNRVQPHEIRMKLIWRLPASCRSFTFNAHYSLTCRHKSTITYDPLRILFCGSEDFSIASLRALHKEHIDRPDTIASIDVVCRPGKRVGRGLKAVREGRCSLRLPEFWASPNMIAVPIQAVAKELALPVHNIDTFTGWLVGLYYRHDDEEAQV